MECVGHVQKHLGKKLRDLKKKTFVDDNGQVLNLRWGGKGRWTNSVIDKSDSLLRRDSPKFSRGRGWNAQSNLGCVPPLFV